MAPRMKSASVVTAVLDEYSCHGDHFVDSNVADASGVDFQYDTVYAMQSLASSVVAAVLDEYILNDTLQQLC